MTQARSRLRAALLTLALTLTLAACQSAEERAQEHYESAVALLEEGESERALVELRNVFDLNGQHRDARALYAATVLEMGRTREAMGQYLRLVEQYPEDREALVALSQLALTQGAWDIVRRYGNRVRDLAPEDPDVRALAASIDYADALEAEDPEARRAAAERALALLETRPDDLPLYRIAIDDALRAQALDTAVERLDAALAVAPEARDLHDMRLRVLVGQQDMAGLEAALRARRAQFPDDREAMSDLVRFLLSEDRGPEAEAVLADYVAAAPDAEAQSERQVLRIGFLLEQRGPEAALDALDTAIADAEAPTGLRSLRARIRFDQGETGPAIAELEDLLEGAGTSDAENDARILLARMLERTGNRVGAQRRVAEVLEADAGQIEALKLRAAWDIEADAVDAAIAALRSALDTAPDDTGAMTLMAQAHLRNGDRALAGDMLSLAADVSGRAPEETRRYAAFLMQQERWLAAEEALIAALRQTPRNLPMMLDLARVYRGMEDWVRASDVERSLRGWGTEEATQAADGLQAIRLAAEGRTEDAVAFLEGLAGETGGGDLSVRLAVLRARLSAGDLEGARAYADTLLAEEPDALVRRLAHAATLQAVGDLEAAEAGFRALVEDVPQLENAWMSLVRLAYAQGDSDRAEAILSEALAALPEGPNLLWTQASLLERRGDAEGALAIYERLYTAAPNNVVIANNLASLLSTLRDDADSLERAWTVARRLREAEIPAFQDTYGWIAHRRGDTETAIAHLEPAAAGLPDDPAVQYHLGMAYLAADRPEDAAAQFRRALEIELPGPPPPQVARARAELEALEAGAPTGE
ncbi:tetratricopeptide repeat protein [Jannaschia seohaensis]|uniref:Tetratricopeptide repeat protein n=1 Tax=Jannaschia seohaensis TaxID=475081 RepID=A0A2Y9B8W8_9RHOB|nr:tetratricopeptide repeat protein [Jannaschia seohaensis]PWJ12871.1 tetratricopeptide repeat protein [Jannaschia seohaensis]SSA50679.1 Tetratricopeptide repeat-containing protein [Jannaschia seohaensis]